MPLSTEEPLNTIGGYPRSETFYVSVIEDPLASLDPKDQTQPRYVLKPTPYLAPTLEIAFFMAAKDILPDADLMRCRVRVASNG
jgi:hypothetical protein